MDFTNNPTYFPTFHACSDLMANTYSILENGVIILIVSMDRWRNFPVYCVFDYNPSGNDSTSSVARTLFARQLIYMSKKYNYTNEAWINRPFNQHYPNKNNDELYRMSQMQ